MNVIIIDPEVFKEKLAEFILFYTGCVRTALSVVKGLWFTATSIDRLFTEKFIPKVLPLAEELTYIEEVIAALKEAHPESKEQIKQYEAISNLLSEKIRNIVIKHLSRMPVIPNMLKTIKEITYSPELAKIFYEELQTRGIPASLKEATLKFDMQTILDILSSSLTNAVNDFAEYLEYLSKRI